MKLLFTSFLAFFGVFSISNAQTIDEPNIPTNGIVINFDQLDDIINFDNSEPWDFSSIVPTSTYSMSVLPVDSSTSAENYPNATHVLISDNGEFFLGYDSNGFKSYGKIGISTVTNYSTPLLLISYPFNSDISHQDSITSTVVWNGFDAPVTDKIEISGINSGSLTMPDGTVYSNAILLSSTRTTVNGPLFDNYLTVEEVSHQWWVSGYPLPVIESLEVYSNSNFLFSRTLFMKNNPASVYTVTSKPKKLLKLTDMLGRNVEEKSNTPLFYFYDDGSYEKKWIID